MISLCQKIASTIAAIQNCERMGNQDWVTRHTDTLAELAKLLPHGSGFDGKTEIDVACSNDSRIIIRTEYHHMDANGCYDGWTEHTLTVRAHLMFAFTVSVSGRNRNGIKDYIAETYEYILSTEVKPT